MKRREERESEREREREKESERKRDGKAYENVFVMKFYVLYSSST